MRSPPAWLRRRFVFSGPGSARATRSASGRDPRSRPPRREARSRRCRHLRQRRSSHARGAHGAGVRDLQGGRGAAVARGAGSSFEGRDPCVALIPHYDNAEGGTHDTRYLLSGRRAPGSFSRRDPRRRVRARSRRAHGSSPSTSIQDEATIAGNGRVTVRVKRFDSSVLEVGPGDVNCPTSGPGRRSGSRVATAAGGDEQRGGGGRWGRSGARVRQATVPRAPGRRRSVPAGRRSSKPSGPTRPPSGPDATPATRRPWSGGDPGSGGRDVVVAGRPLQSDEMDRGRAALRSMLSELGRVAEAGTRPRATVVGTVRRSGPGPAGRGPGRRTLRRRRRRP
jgi:hypothetical protein